MGRVCFPHSHQLCMSHLHAVNLISPKEKGIVLGFLEAGGSFKAGACCQSDLVSMEAASRAACSCQLGAWRSLSPQQASGQLPLEEGSPGNPASVFLLLSFCHRSSVWKESRWLLVPLCTFPRTCIRVAFITALGIPPLRILLGRGILLGDEDPVDDYMAFLAISGEHLRWK